MILALALVVLVIGASVRYVVTMPLKSRKRRADFESETLLQSIEVDMDPDDWTTEGALLTLQKTFQQDCPDTVIAQQASMFLFQEAAKRRLEDVSGAVAESNLDDKGKIAALRCRLCSGPSRSKSGMYVDSTVVAAC